MKPITPDKIAKWRDEMRRFENVVVPGEDFATILEIIDGRSHGGCFCPHCNPQPDAAPFPEPKTEAERVENLRSAIFDEQ